MTRTIAAILAFTPGMLLAQAKTPAQPSSTPVLQSALLQPAAFVTGKTSDNGTASSTPGRVSTGIVAPRLIHQAGLAEGTNHNRVFAVDRTVVVKFVVDATGKPTNLELAQPSDPSLDHEVLTTISQFRYKPGTLNGQPVPVPVRLEYILQHGVSY